jgi:hypothetical protein
LPGQTPEPSMIDLSPLLWLTPYVALAVLLFLIPTVNR